MSEQVLKDSRYNVIGYIQTQSNGTQVIKDARYNVKGYYEPKTNITKDARYNEAGKGNLLTTLL